MENLTNLLGQISYGQDEAFMEALKSAVQTGSAPQDKVFAALLEKEVSSRFVPVGLDEASGRLVNWLWQLLLSGRSQRARRSWHVNFILLRRLSWLNPIIRPCINTIRQEIKQLQWDIVVNNPARKGISILVRRLLHEPHPNLSWMEWIDKMLEDSLALDAAASELWTARYIPFHLTIPVLQLREIERRKERKPAGVPVPAGTPEADLLAELIGEGGGRRMGEGLAFTRRMAETVAKERVSWLSEVSGVKESDIRRYMGVMYEQLQKAEDIAGAYRIMFEEGPIILRKTIGGTEDEILMKAKREKEKEVEIGVEEPPPLEYPMDLPIAIIPVPGEQIEFQGDIYMMVEDSTYPYLRVINGVVIRAYTRDELMYVKENPRTWSFYGLSPIECVIIVSHVMLYAHDLQFRYFLTGAVPAAIVAVTGGGDISELRRWVSEIARGKQESIGVIGLPPNGNMIVHNLAQTNRELQYNQLLEWYARLICIAFGLQPWELGILSGGTPSRRMLRQRPGVYGRFITWENAINYNILRKGFHLSPDDIYFRFVNRDVGDFLEELDSLRNSVTDGIVTRNEARQRLSLPQLEGGLADHAYTVSGNVLILHGRTPPLDREKVEVPAISAPVGVWVPPPAGGLGIPAGGAARGAGAGLGALGGMLGLAKEMGATKKLYSQQKFNELRAETRNALKLFARAIIVGGECANYDEAFNIAFIVRDTLCKSFRREITDKDWVDALRGIVEDLWQTKWAAEWSSLMASLEPTEVRNVLGNPPLP